MSNDPPQTIASLTEALRASWTACEAATSHRQRKARNGRVISAGIALYERLETLKAWLHAHDTDADEPAYLANLKKYEQGWAALTNVANAIDEWKRTHYEEIAFDRSRFRRSTGGGSRKAAGAAEGGAGGKTRGEQVALARGIIEGHRSAVAREPDAGVQQSHLL